MDAKQLFESGKSQYLLFKFEEALIALDESIKLDQNYAPAYYFRGSTKFMLGKNEDAIKDFNKAIELDPKYADAYNNRGSVKHSFAEYEDAIKDFNKAIELDPKHAQAYNNKGKSNVELGKYDEAFADFTKAAEIDPSNQIYLQNRSNAQQQTQISKMKKDLEEKYRYRKENKELQDITQYFDSELEFYEKRSRRYFWWFIGILAVILVAPLGLFFIDEFEDGVIELLLLLPLEYHFNLYLYLTPLIAIETLLFFIYKKSDRLMHFYRHKTAIAGSLEYVIKNPTNKSLEKYDDFKLQQYAKLYEPPSFIGKTSVTLKPDSFSVKNSENN